MLFIGGLSNGKQMDVPINADGEYPSIYAVPTRPALNYSLVRPGNISKPTFEYETYVLTQLVDGHWTNSRKLRFYRIHTMSVDSAIEWLEKR